MGNVQAEGQKDREGAAMQKRTGTRAGAPETKKGGGHREERGINHSTERGIPRTITPAQGGVDGTPVKTPLANGQLLPGRTLIPQ